MQKKIQNPPEQNEKVQNPTYFSFYAVSFFICTESYSILLLIDMMQNLPRILQIDQKIRESELFPRIRDAEREMIRNEKEFQKKRKKLLIQQNIKNNTSIQDMLKKNQEKMMMKKKNSLLPLIEPPQPSNCFTMFSLNHDPKNIDPTFDVYFPRLFNDDHTIIKARPDSIETFWMLGFIDHINNTSKTNIDDNVNVITPKTKIPSIIVKKLK